MKKSSWTIWWALNSMMCPYKRHWKERKDGVKIDCGWSNSTTSQRMSRIAGRHQELGEWHEMDSPLEASEEPMC